MAIKYELNRDGKNFIRVRSDPKPIKPEMLQNTKGILETNLGATDAIKGLAPEQAQAVHGVWEKFRDPIGKGILTWEEAVTKMQAPWTEELTAVKAALDILKEP
jgi:hypothetical protein